MRHLIVPLVFLSLVAGCASIEKFERRMDAYLGWDLDRLRAHFGYNYIEREIGDGQRAYTWVWTEHNLRPGYHAPDVIESYRTETGTRYIVSPGTYFPPEYYEYICEFSFIVGPDNNVLSWRAHGNGCLSYTGPGTVFSHTPPVETAPR